MESDKDYFERRAEEELRAAKISNEAAQAAHSAMAARYKDLALAIARREYALGLDLFDAADWPSLGVQGHAAASNRDQPRRSPAASH